MNEIKIVIEGMKELTEAIQRLAGQNEAAPVSATSVPQAPAALTGVPNAAMGAPGPVVAGQPQQMPGYTAAGQAGVPIQQPGMQTNVPTTTAAPGYTIEQLQVAAAGLMSAGKGAHVMAILQRFGIQAMTELPPEQYGSFGTALREAGAQI